MKTIKPKTVTRVKKKVVKKTKKISGVDSYELTSCSPLEETHLFDFLNYQSGYNNNHGFTAAFSNPVPSINLSRDGALTYGTEDKAEEQSKPPLKIKVKPIDVLNELETIPTPWNLNNLDDKLKILNDKRDLITQQYAKREVVAMIERLENRKKYTKHRLFFENFQNTNDEKIDNLLAKYDLIIRTSDLFIPEFPDVAIEIMTEYTKNVVEISGKKPIFYVIATEDKFRKAYEKRDPILLVQSPFGFYWQILAAYDLEMILLSEL